MVSIENILTLLFSAFIFIILQSVTVLLVLNVHSIGDAITAGFTLQLLTITVAYLPIHLHNETK